MGACSRHGNVSQANLFAFLVRDTFASMPCHIAQSNHGDSCFVSSFWESEWGDKDNRAANLKILRHAAFFVTAIFVIKNYGASIFDMSPPPN